MKDTVKVPANAMSVGEFIEWAKKAVAEAPLALNPEDQLIYDQYILLKTEADLAKQELEAKARQK